MVFFKKNKQTNSQTMTHTGLYLSIWLAYLLNLLYSLYKNWKWKKQVCWYSPSVCLSLQEINRNILSFDAQRSGQNTESLVRTGLILLLVVCSSYRLTSYWKQSLNRIQTFWIHTCRKILHCTQHVGAGAFSCGGSFVEFDQFRI